MRRVAWVAISVVVLVAGACSSGGSKSGLATSSPVTSAPHATVEYAFSIGSSAFANGQAIPKQYTCDGAKTSPPLRWLTVSPGVTNVALVVDDPDAPLPGGFVHWIVVGMPLDGSVAAGRAPKGIELRNSAGTNGWTPPCPPSGTHHYHFTLYALRHLPEVRADMAPHDAIAAIKGAAATHTELVGTYSRG